MTAHRVALGGVAVAVTALSFGCGDRDATHRDAAAGASGESGSSGAGAGGSSGTGAGAGGSSGAGAGAGGSSGGPPELVPDCIRALMAPCPYDAECKYVPNEHQKTARICLENGTAATYDYSNDGPCTPGDTITTHVYASDGSLCYTTVRTMGAGCESSSAIWFDTDGNPIATESVSYPSTNVTLVCRTGDSATCSAPCDTLRPFCTAGDCPSPP